jgi:voltage-gated potassium channel
MPNNNDPKKRPTNRYLKSIEPAPHTVKQRIHEVIFGADTFYGALFDILLFVAIIASILVVSLETVPEIKSNSQVKSWLYWSSWAFTIFFTIEYLLRLYCVRKPSKYARSFWGIIDLLAFLPDYFVPFLGGHASFSVIRALRLLRVFRIFKLGWFQQEAEDLGGAVYRSRAKITVFITVVLVLVTVAGTLMYEIESFAGAENTQFDSIPEGIYWAIVTMTTVGYGDIVPVTLAGKILSAILILIGYSLIIVPTGFVSAEFLAQKTNATSTRSCASCITEGHDADSVYCKYCGDKFD